MNVSISVDSSKGVVHIDRAIAKLTDAVKKVVVHTSQDGLEYAAMTSPQYSGAFASNWRLALNKEVAGKAKSEGPLDDPLEEGNEGSLGAAFQSKETVKAWTPKDVVYLSTWSEDERGASYSWKIEANVMNFRQENPSRGALVRRTSQVMGLNLLEGTERINKMRL